VRGGTPLGRVLGLGAAGHGAHHWWVQRVTALALLPLGIWLAVSVLGLPDLGHATLATWAGGTLNATLLLLTLLTATWHSHLGVQVVIEDYVHGPAVKPASLVLSSFVHAIVAVAGTLAILKLAFAAT
jgi:succinate dehydrogenase / fumarate reductase membrane anchor subunit